MPLILPGNVGSATAATGYNVDNSVRFNDGDSPSLKDSASNAAPSGTRTKFTFSIWFKRGVLGTTQTLGAAAYSSSDEGYFQINSDDKFEWDSTESAHGNLITNRVFRDVSAWYHIVIAVDTSQGTAANRMKIYINGTQETSFATETYPDQNSSLYWNVGGTYYPYIGRKHGGEYFDGYIAEVVNIDNQQLAADQFGEFDSDSEIWKPIDVSGLTFGTAGYYLDFEDSSELGKDVSGVGNSFVSANLAATDQSTDTCTNNFATMNPLDNFYAAHPFSEGNLNVTLSTSTTSFSTSTFGVSTGKWYWESKCEVARPRSVGITDRVSTAADNYPGQTANNYSMNGINGNVYSADAQVTYTGASYTAGDIIGILLNLDDNELKFSKNGTILNSGTAISITAPASTLNGVYFAMVGDESTDTAGRWSLNFGSPSFAISSGNADGNGYGNFEYAVPSGFFSLCTKNLAEYG